MLVDFAGQRSQTMLERGNLGIGGVALSFIELAGKFVEPSRNGVQMLNGFELLLLTLEAAPRRMDDQRHLKPDLCTALRAAIPV